MATTLDSLAQQVNALTKLVNTMITQSKNISQLPDMSPINYDALLPLEYDGAEFKLPIKSLGVLAIGQAEGSGYTQYVDSNVLPLTIFDLNAVANNMIVNQGPTEPTYATFKPASDQFSGYYYGIFVFNISTTAAEEIYFDWYGNDVATGYRITVHTDAQSKIANGTMAFVSKNQILPSDTFEIRVSSTNPATVTFDQATVLVFRVG